MTTRYYNIYNRTIYDLLRNQSAGETVEVNDKNYDEETRRIVAEQQQLFETELKKYEDRIKIETEKQRQENIKLGVEAKLINDEKEALLQKLKEDEKYYSKRAEDFLKLGKYYGYMQGNLPVIARDYGKQSVNYKDSIDKAIQVLRANGEEAIIENDDLLLPLHKESMKDNIRRMYELQKHITDINKSSSLLDATYYNDETGTKIIAKINKDIKNTTDEELESTLLGGIHVGQNARFYPPFGYAKSLNPNTFTNDKLYKILSTKASGLLNQYKKK